MFCKCGCGEPLPPSNGARDREYASDAHRKRAERRRNRERAVAERLDVPDVEPGAVDESLVEAVRVWASRTDVREGLGPETTHLAMAYAAQAARGHVPSGLLLRRIFADAQFVAPRNLGGCPGDDCPWELVKLLGSEFRYPGNFELFDYDCSHRLLADISLVRSVENYRAERAGRALRAGDDAEAARWEKVVPIGCARGDHHWNEWPSGGAACVDCQVIR